MKLSDYFDRSEFACRCGCGGDTVDAELLDVLVYMRKHFGSPVVINSGFRCFKYNQQIGGSTNSQHMTGKAADVRVMGVHPDAVADWLEGNFKGFGIGRYDRFTHIDVREQKARWDLRSKRA